MRAETGTVAESKLIAMLMQGSQAAFGEIYHRYAKLLYVFCLRYCKSAEESEEIVADAFVQLWQHRDSLRRTDTVRPLLFVTVRRRLVNAFRARVASPVYASYQELGVLHPADGVRADRQLEYDDFVRRLYALLDGLPPSQRRVFVMSRLEGCRNREIMEALGLSEQTVKNQLSMALKYVRAHLRPLCLMALWLSAC